MNNTNLKISIPIYDCYCNVIVTENINLAIKKTIKTRKWCYETLNLKEDSEYYGLCINPGNMKEYLLYLCSEELYISTISHEISHIIDYIIGDRGIENNGEARAYLTGYLTDKILSSLAKKDLLKDKYLIKTKENV